MIIILFLNLGIDTTLLCGRTTNAGLFSLKLPVIRWDILQVGIIHTNVKCDTRYRLLTSSHNTQQSTNSNNKHWLHVLDKCTIKSCPLMDDLCFDHRITNFDTWISELALIGKLTAQTTLGLIIIKLIFLMIIGCTPWAS